MVVVVVVVVVVLVVVAADWYLVECYIFTSYELSYVAAPLNYKFCRGSEELHKEQATVLRLISHELTSSALRQMYHRLAMHRVCRVFRMHAFVIVHLLLR